MKAKKTIFILSALFTLLLMLLIGAAFHIYAHPPLLRDIIQKSISGATGAAISIGHLSYSINPIEIRAKKIVVRSSHGNRNLKAEIEEAFALCLLEGDFARKTLVVSAFKVKGVKCRILEGKPGVSADSENGSPSFLNSILKSMSRLFVSIFLFRDIRLETADIKAGSVTASLGGHHIRVSDVNGHLNRDHQLDMACNIAVASPLHELTASVSGFRVVTGSPLSLKKPSLDLEVTFKNGELSGKGTSVKSIQAETSIHYDHGGQKLLFHDLNLILGEIKLADFAAKDGKPLNVTIQAGGDIDLKSKKASFDQLSLDAKNIFYLQGSLDAEFGNEPYFNVNIQNGRMFPGELTKLLSQKVQMGLRGIGVSGPVHVAGMFGGRKKKDQWLFDSDVTAEAKQMPVSYDSDGMKINGLVTSRISFKGPLSRLNLRGKLKGDELQVENKNLLVKSAQGAFDFSGSYPDLDIKGLSFFTPHMNITHEQKSLSVSNIRITAKKGHLNLAERSIKLPEIGISSSLLNNLGASFRMSQKGLVLKANGKSTGLIAAASRLELLPKDWTFKGTDTVDVTASAKKNGTIAFSGELGLENLSFQSPEETALGESISMGVRISGIVGPASSQMSASAEMWADVGEVLMDRFYFDLAEDPIKTELRGRYQMAKRGIYLDQLSLKMGQMAKALLTGTLLRTENGYQGDFSLSFPETPLNPLFEKLILEPFQMENPALSKVRADGVVSMEMAVRGTRSKWGVTGSCNWKKGTLAFEDSHVVFNGVQLSLPIWLTRGIDEKAPGNLAGRLSVDAMQFPSLPQQALNIPLKAGPNRLSLPAATSLTVPGGTLHLGPTRVMGLMTSSPTVHTSLSFDNLHLGPLLSKIWPQPIKGTAQGSLNPVRIIGGSLTSKGEITADVFDGTVTLSNVNARGLFSALPVYGLDARWHHLNLARMTEGTPFGKIEGILNGYATDLEVSNGQIQRFDLLLDTVKTDGVPQRISVKAVDNIARLGGGQSPFAGMAGILVSLFKEFPYKKIGVHASLENDLFRINGTIHENGKEYLVKRGFFSGVDVINQNKGNSVGFKDMLKRIKRIADSKGGPIVR